jgi:hypothetical protein
MNISNLVQSQFVGKYNDPLRKRGALPLVSYIDLTNGESGTTHVQLAITD